MSDTKIDDGGAAFPTPDCTDWDGPERTKGMTLRDHLVGQVLSGWCKEYNAMSKEKALYDKNNTYSTHEPEQVIAFAEELADLWIERRKGTPS